uniref:Coiled-coil-helix-coiled-coil-helix domain containing 5 n=1 Tax=Rousettus aegyptiacus TaxID=9407 RepID=A0A7J8FF08_ROUAE|nr:coiled-coil-helix-coiled-coil-helix domain containing 5 [Rousettus aegyptiacus]
MADRGRTAGSPGDHCSPLWPGAGPVWPVCGGQARVLAAGLSPPQDEHCSMHVLPSHHPSDPPGLCRAIRGLRGVSPTERGSHQQLHGAGAPLSSVCGAGATTRPTHHTDRATSWHLRILRTIANWAGVSGA